MAGRAAVRYALQGENDKIVTLRRVPGDRYESITGLASLEDVGGKVKTMPEEFKDRANDFVTMEFVRYALPLVGGRLPRFGSALR